MSGSGRSIPHYPRIERYTWVLVVVWIGVVATSLAWNIYHTKKMTLGEAYIQAKISFDKDVLYRRWSSGHGGVYVAVTEKTPANPYLSHYPERDITTSSGKHLTLMNPAYMSRQVYELQEKESGVKGHITSLKPVNPVNVPDPWEERGLKAFELGQPEVSSVEKINGKDYMRLMRPLITGKDCLRCHGDYGSKEGEIRGGISVSIPMEPLWVFMNSRIRTISLSHLLLGGIGLTAIFWGMGRIKREDLKRRMVEEEREKLIQELEETVIKVRMLSGLLPICASCKKVRDDKGYWTQIETYIRDHSEAEFSHGICPECMKKLYPDLM
ncbi:MAG: DUF3365 domain-containing protein [Deltaproteobacteria bacterium]|nr:DUF3365 domain-containing protein [Deltaproteobacteria bacterium]